MANTFELIEAVTVGSGGAARIDFNTIPSTYTDLCVKLSTRNTGGSIANYCYIYFNTSSSNFSGRVLGGDGASATSTSTQYTHLDDGGGATANTFANSEYYIPNYNDSSAYQSFSVDSVSENNATTAYSALGAGLWAQTAAITQIWFQPQSGSFAQYSTAYLYGVKNA